MTHSPLHKALCCALITASPLFGAYARHLSPDEALNRLYSIESQKRMAGASSLKLAYVESDENEEYVYVFNKKSDGFVIVSADDRMPALLGYSERGAFDEDNAAPALKWWLGQYAKEAAAVFSCESTDKGDSRWESTKEKSNKEKIPYLLTTTWGQRNPYNLDCPQLDGETCVTGCVATAMAQVIKYHGYPEKGNSSHSYAVRDTITWGADSIREFDFANATFQYADMLDSYDPSATEEERAAVAQLLYACGVSVDMEYTPDESGASDIFIAYALRNYFNYANDVRIMKKDFFFADEWENLIYSEIKDQRPVIMGGQAPGGGHQFVCDGYDGDGFFHINWGWEGMGDGYFLLTALNPPVQGTGGHEGGYNSNLSAIVGIQPPVDDTPIWYPIYANGAILANDPTKTSVTVSFEQTPGIGLFNNSQEEVKVGLLIKAIAEDEMEYLGTPIEFSFPGATGLRLYGYNNLGTMSLPYDLPDGTYKCFLMIETPEGILQEVMFPYTSAAYFNLSINSDGSVNCSAGDPRAQTDIRVIKFEPEGEAIAEETTRFFISIDNIGEIEYSGAISYKMYPHGSDEAINSMTITLNSIAPGQTFNGYLNLTFPSAGEFDFIFFDQAGKQISDTFTIEILESGVESIMGEYSSSDVYSPSGMLLKRNADKEYVRNLPKGLYILRSNGTSKTIIK